MSCDNNYSPGGASSAASWSDASLADIEEIFLLEFDPTESDLWIAVMIDVSNLPSKASFKIVVVDILIYGPHLEHNIAA